MGVQPISVAIGDFNGDGSQDFATANPASNTVSIRLGNGLGGFSGTTNVATGNTPQSVAIGDFNSDGKQDFATANNSSNSYRSVWGVAMKSMYKAMVFLL
ncbi:MAG: VCBS repeat-containing protein [Haliscomenobacter sp.]|nr:VCBS repeat-containing protein [Haliscomenobacter sp.]